MNKPTEKTPYVFVYGTLMEGLGNHNYLGRSEKIDTATTEEKYKLEANGIPYLTEEGGTTYVRGEVYEVTERILRQLDGLEGHPSWYQRKIINVVNEIGDRVKAWTYFMQDEVNATLIESGDYREYLEHRLYNNN